MEAAVPLALAAIALGHALQVSNGTLHPAAIAWLTIAGSLSLAALLVPRVPSLERWSEPAAALAVGAGLVLQFAELFTRPPGIYLQLGTPQDIHPFRMGLAAAAVLAGAALSKAPWPGRAAIPLLLITHFLLGAWILAASPSPFIDVYMFQRDAAEALLAGTNPYAMTFPDIYGRSALYGPGLSEHGRLTFGLIYPPLSLFLAVPGHLLAGDYRYSQLVALTVSGALMAYARPGRLAAAAVALFLFTPRVFFVLEQGWTEPYLVLLLSATVFAACRFPRAVPYVFGLFLAVKQYLVFAVPLAWLLLPRPRPRWSEVGRLALKGFAVGLAVTLPMAMWDLTAFVRDVVTVHFLQPFRPDSLSYVAWLARPGRPPLPDWTAVIAAGTGIVLALWRAPRTPAGFAAAVALGYLGFFSFSKQAFCNYYFFVVGALCCAVAVMGQSERCGREG